MSVMDDPQTLSFEECERRVMQDLADNGLELGSKAHQDTVVRRPLQPSVKPVFDALLESHQLMFRRWSCWLRWFAQTIHLRSGLRLMD